jgi:hypothetical protein
VAIREWTGDAPEHWPDLGEIEQALAESGVLLLPEQVAQDDGTTVAFFRTESQEIRVRAKEAGIEPRLLAPAGANLATHSEHAADWVLPTLLAATLAVPAQLAADLIHDRVQGQPHEQIAPANVCYREAIVEHGRLRLRVIEGPTREVEARLRERLQTPEELPRLSQEPPD